MIILIILGVIIVALPTVLIVASIFLVSRLGVGPGI